MPLAEKVWCPTRGSGWCFAGLLTGKGSKTTFIWCFSSSVFSCIPGSQLRIQELSENHCVGGFLAGS